MDSPTAISVRSSWLSSSTVASGAVGSVVASDVGSGSVGWLASVSSGSVVEEELASDSNADSEDEGEGSGDSKSDAKADHDVPDDNAQASANEAAHVTGSPFRQQRRRPLPAGSQVATCAGSQRSCQAVPTRRRRVRLQRLGQVPAVNVQPPFVKLLNRKPFVVTNLAVTVSDGSAQRRDEPVVVHLQERLKCFMRPTLKNRRRYQIVIVLDLPIRYIMSTWRCGPV